MPIATKAVTTVYPKKRDQKVFKNNISPKIPAILMNLVHSLLNKFAINSRKHFPPHLVYDVVEKKYPLVVEVESLESSAKKIQKVDEHLIKMLAIYLRQQRMH